MYQAIEKYGLIHRRVELIRKNATETESKSHLCDKYRVGEKYSALRKSFIRESSEAATLIAWSRSLFPCDGFEEKLTPSPSRSWRDHCCWILSLLEGFGIRRSLPTKSIIFREVLRSSQNGSQSCDDRFSMGGKRQTICSA